MFGGVQTRFDAELGCDSVRCLLAPAKSGSDSPTTPIISLPAEFHCNSKEDVCVASVLQCATPSTASVLLSIIIISVTRRPNHDRVFRESQNTGYDVMMAWVCQEIPSSYSQSFPSRSLFVACLFSLGLPWFSVATPVFRLRNPKGK